MQDTTSTIGATITVTVKNNYGSEAIYPACPRAKLFAELTETKTLTRSAIETIKALGFTIEVYQPEVKL